MLTVVIMLLLGVLFMYAAVKGKDPRQLVKDALAKKK